NFCDLIDLIKIIGKSIEIKSVLKLKFAKFRQNYYGQFYLFCKLAN
ncbi:21618_t:CDS:1, partial [Rhizophagus irregularis]